MLLYVDQRLYDLEQGLNDSIYTYCIFPIRLLTSTQSRATLLLSYELRVYLLCHVFIAEGTFGSLAILLTFSINFRFTTVTLETLGSYYWGLWLHKICVCDLRYVYHVLSEAQNSTPIINWRWIIIFKILLVTFWNLFFIFEWPFMNLSNSKAFLPIKIQFIFVFEISITSFVILKYILPTCSTYHIGLTSTSSNFRSYVKHRGSVEA